MAPTRLTAGVGALLFVTLLAAAGANGSEPAPKHVVLALIVTNNRSEQLGRPDLRYADDDGAKYYEVFRMLGSAEQVTLLSEFDADTARLFPALLPIVKPPSRANVAKSAEQLARQADALRSRGVTVDFYFIFAGHGDVDRGRGFIELSDGPITADDLEAMIFRRVRASNLHIILDSCNAFFVINPRKPGGHRFPTPQQAAAEISARLPNVGVFLSTSAEAQVYEWSELQSGIFSHAVRSGLTGAADADGDGRITYSELAAFVSLASKNVRNPLYRPTVFARGPGGNNGAALVDLSNAEARTLELPAGEQRRVTVRDADELRWIDVHAEAQTPVRLHLPERLGQHFAVELRSLDEAGRVVSRREGRAGADRSTSLAELSSGAESGGARGPGDIFRGLFAEPFGPLALTAYLAEEGTKSPMPIGIAQEDVERMHLLLAQTAAMERSRRLGAVATRCIAGGLAIGLGSGILATKPEPGTEPFVFMAGAVLVAGGAVGCMTGALVGRRPSIGEQIFAEFETNLSRPPAEQQHEVAKTEQRLFRLYRDEQSGRRWNLISGWLLAGLGSVGLGLSFIPNRMNTTAMTLVQAGLGLVTAVGIEAGILASFETPIERMVRVWAKDPGIQRIPRVGIFAAPGGAALSVSGKF